MAADASGEEAVIADVAEVAVGDVSNEATEEFQDRESHGSGRVCVMIEIFEGNGSAVVSLDACFTERRTLEIFADIFDCGFSVIRLFVEVDDPGFLIKDIEPGVEGCVGFEVFEFGWEAQTARHKFGAEEVDDGITPHAFDGFMGKINVREPGFTIQRESAGGGGQMDMAVALQIASEGMQGQKDAGKKQFFCGPLFNDIGGKTREVVEKVTIAPEERLQDIR